MKKSRHIFLVKYITTNVYIRGIYFQIDKSFEGEVAERLNATVLKTVDPLRGPWVRIPPSPPFTYYILMKSSYNL